VDRSGAVRVDRQTLSLLAPYLKVDYHWSNTDYAYLVIAFRVAYSIGQPCSRDASSISLSAPFRGWTWGENGVVASGWP
jgi:hypothetical protein